MLKEAPWWVDRTPNQIVPIPFLHPRVIAYLESLLRPEWRILEHGSGGSTLWFAERCEKVRAIEQDKKWVEVISSKAVENITIVWDNYWDGPPYPDYDLMLIDGGPLIVRGYYIKKSYDFVKPHGAVVLDNANREEYATERKWLQDNCDHFETYDCNDLASKYLVTEFYFLRGAK